MSDLSDVYAGYDNVGIPPSSFDNLDWLYSNVPEVTYDVPSNDSLPVAQSTNGVVDQNSVQFSNAPTQSFSTTSTSDMLNQFKSFAGTVLDMGKSYIQLDGSIKGQQVALKSNETAAQIAQAQNNVMYAQAQAKAAGQLASAQVSSAFAKAIPSFIPIVAIGIILVLVLRK